MQGGWQRLLSVLGLMTSPSGGLCKELPPDRCTAAPRPQREAPEAVLQLLFECTFRTDVYNTTALDQRLSFPVDSSCPLGKHMGMLQHKVTKGYRTMAWTQTSSAAHWALGREMIACSSCHQTYLGDMEMEKNSLQDRSGLEDKCSPLLHPWGLAVWSPPCSRSQPHKDLMELRALHLHSTNLMQQAEARTSFKRRQNQTVTAQDCDCVLIFAKGRRVQMY